MEKKPHKAWSMKHPALARVFAVVLAIMSVILIAGGVSGIGKNAEENEERLRYEERFAGRIDRYVELTEKLENSISYEEAYAELEKILEQHESDASKHKTDLALYTAEKGGNTMGANMIWEAKPQLAAARAELEAGKAQLEEQEQQLNMIIQNEQLIRAAAYLVASGDAGCEKLIAELTAAIEMLENASASDTEPGAGEQPAPELPSLPDFDLGDMPEFDLGELPDIDLGIEIDPEWGEQIKDAVSGVMPISETESVPIEKVEVPSVDYEAVWAQIQAAVPQINELIAILESLNDHPGLEHITVPDILNHIASITSNEDAIAIANAMIELLNHIDSLFDSANEVFAPMMEVLDNKELTLKMLEEGKAQLIAGEEALRMGEHEMQKALEDIWYNLGELEKDRLVLEETRDRLNEEASALSKRILETDELQELENSHVSAKLLLTSVKEVNDMFEESGELVPSAERYLEDYKAETVKLQKGRMLVSILAIVGGIAGIAAFPAAYELLHKRAWLIVPVLVSIVLAAAAEAVHYFVVGEMWYVGLFAAIIAVLHLLVVLPKEKRPAIITET